MGQYYKPVFLNEKNKPVGHVDSHDFGSGLKLMEHSWMKNPFVRFVEQQLINQPRKIVWAGDYADNENPKTLSLKELKPHVDNDSPHWNLDVLKKEGINLYTLADNSPKLSTSEEVYDEYEHDYKYIAPLRFKYLVNFDKKEFVDKTKTAKDSDGWQIHPLPLLTCEGNNRGGGDYRGKEKGLVGRWSRDTIGVFSKKSDIPKGFNEVVFDLTE